MQTVGTHRARGSKGLSGGAPSISRCKPNRSKADGDAQRREGDASRPCQRDRATAVMTAKAFHPLADLLPLIGGVEFDRLVDDIAEQGLLNPITLYEGQVLDGRPGCASNTSTCSSPARAPLRFRRQEACPPPSCASGDGNIHANPKFPTASSRPCTRPYPRSSYSPVKRGRDGTCGGTRWERRQHRMTAFPTFCAGSPKDDPPWDADGG